ncbi:ribonuclease HI family protein [Candidatus Falkowbacteria bacterium]|nr:ribonuclease HI family protein [Candidatus Falkowbacteria bacterium]
MKAILHTDGGARGNPGPAGIGVVLEIGKEKKLFKKYIGEATNNQAEYRALILGLEKAKEFGVEEIKCYLDSELVVKQLNREYKVKDKGLAPLFVKIWNLAQGFKKISYKHIFREQNKLADRLVNEAIDERVYLGIWNGDVE